MLSTIGLAAALCASLAADAFASGRPGHADRRPYFEDATAEAGLDYVHHVRTRAPDCIFNAGQFCEPEHIPV